MKQQEIYIQSIYQAYPEFKIISVKINDEGQNNNIFIINDEFIFRFPRYTHTIKQLKIETAILEGIQDYITLNIPNPLFKNLDTEVIGQAFVGYRLIPGEPLWPKKLLEINDYRKLEILAEQLAKFLKELHGVPVREVIPYELPISDTYEEWADIYARIQKNCFPYMRLDAHNWTRKHFETYLNDSHNFAYKPVLKHGDFGTSNILFDRKTQTINGIIDFGGASLGDPAYDFAGILSGYGESFLQLFRKTYPQIETFWKRILFYKGTFALLEALFGIENDDEAAFRSGIEDYV